MFDLLLHHNLGSLCVCVGDRGVRVGGLHVYECYIVLDVVLVSAKMRQ